MRLWRRRNRRVRAAAARKRLAMRTVGWVATCAVAAVLAAAGGDFLWQALQSCPHFAIREVRVEGTSRVRSEDILELAGIQTGTSSLNLDVAAVRRRVLHHPWVAHAHVRRRLPDGVIVRVRERQAIAALVSAAAAHAVDRHGYVFALLDADAAGRLPRVTGIPLTDPLDAEPHAVSDLRHAARLIRVLGHSYEVAQVDVDRGRGLTVRTAGLPELPIEFGWGNWRRKSRQLAAVLELWAGRERQLAAISLAFADQAVVQLRAGGSGRRLAVRWARGRAG